MKAHEFAVIESGVAALVELPPQRYGALLCIDGDGQRVTVVGDGEALSMALAAVADGVPENVWIPPVLFPLRRNGWPDEWTVAGEPQPEIEWEPRNED